MKDYCMDLLFEASSYHMLTNKQPLLQSPRTKVRGNGCCLLALGGKGNFEREITFCQFFAKRLVTGIILLVKNDRLITTRRKQTLFRKHKHGVARHSSLSQRSGRLVQAGRDGDGRLLPLPRRAQRLLVRRRRPGAIRQQWKYCH